MRDAKNLAWKLDLVLRGVAADSLLDTYTDERRPHVEAIVRASMAAGRLICLTDPLQAAARDAELRSGRGPTPQGLPGLTAGILQRGRDGAPLPPAGALFVQGRVRVGGREGRFDDVVGGGWTLLATEHEPAAHLDSDRRGFLAALGAHVLRVIDLDGVYRRELARLGVVAVLVRPDFYLFGAAADAAGIAVLVDDLRRQLPRKVQP